MSKHTSSPWVLDDVGRIHTEGGRAIARVVYEYLHYGEPARSEIQIEDDANARLIAAAPELLEACECALTAIIKFDEFPQVLKTTGQLVFATELKVKLKTAIAKATGESK